MSIHPLALSYVFDLDELEEVAAREYLRVSKDESGRARSNAEQHDDNVAIAERKRWQLGEPYEDVGSASRFKRKRRLDFDQLFTDLRSGVFDAHVLIIWEASRGSREVPEWYALLGLCQQQGVFIFVTSLRRVFNPRVARDWKDLMTMAVEAEHEVLQLRERQERASSADAAAGSFKGGRRPFGFEPNGVDHRPEEAALIREVVGLLLGGKTTRWLAGELNRRGIRTTAGNAWRPGPLASLLASERIAGKRIHKGEVIGKAVWEPIITELEHRRVLAAFAARAAAPARRGRTPWLLTGLLRCELCGATMVGNVDSGGGTRRYVCRKGPGYSGCGRLGIKAEPLEELLGDETALRLRDVEARRAAAAIPDDAAELAELDEIEELRAAAAEDWAAGPRALGRTREEHQQAHREALAALARRKREVQLRLDAKTANEQPLDLVAGQGGRPWAALELEDKRDRLRALIAHVAVAPASLRGSTRFEAARVLDGDRIAWKV